MGIDKKGTRPMKTIEKMKKKAALEALDYVESGMQLGLGTGSTVKYFVEGLAEKMEEDKDFKVTCYSTSLATSKQADALGIDISVLGNITRRKIKELNLIVDGTDEVDDYYNLIKGGGGALLREKLAASISKKYIIIADSSKRVETLGKFRLPIEVERIAPSITYLKMNESLVKSEKRGYIKFIDENNIKVERRKNNNSNVERKEKRSNIWFISDNRNYIYDCPPLKIVKPDLFGRELSNVTGVVGHGLFLDMATKVIIADSVKGVYEMKKRKK